MSRAGFLDRWSARKQAARATPEPAPDAPPPGEAPPQPPSVSEAEAAEMTDAEVLERLALPDPSAIEDSGALKGFLRQGVPQRLKRIALRRMWALSPHQAALDGLVDYAEDFSDAAVAVETLATTYEVGRGLRAHVDALAAQREAEAGRDDAEPAADPPPAPVDDAADDDPGDDLGDDPGDDAPTAAVAVAAKPAPPPDRAEAGDAAAPPRPRRIAFRRAAAPAEGPAR